MKWIVRVTIVLFAAYLGVSTYLSHFDQKIHTSDVLEVLKDNDVKAAVILNKIVEDDMALFTFSTHDGYGYILYDKGYNDLFAVKKISTHQSDDLGIFDYEDDAILIIGSFNELALETQDQRRELDSNEGILIIKDHFMRDDIIKLQVDGRDINKLYDEIEIEFDGLSKVIFKSIAMVFTGVVLAIFITRNKNSKAKGKDITDGMFEQLNYMK